MELTDRGHYNMFLNFHDALVHDEPIVATVRQNLENMLVVLQALDSAERGHRTDVVAAAVPPAAGGCPCGGRAIQAGSSTDCPVR